VSFCNVRVPLHAHGGEPQDRIRSILINAEGVLNFGLYPQSFTVSVTFDPEKTTTQEIIEALSEGGYPVSGEPKWVR
jgi:copper chaperone CopZ